MWSRLPVELEREIFYLASDSTNDVLRFLQVARCVHVWWVLHHDKSMLTEIAMVRSEPILYTVVKLTREGQARHFITCLRLRKSPHSFAHAAVKSLCIYGRILVTSTLEILQYCSGVTSLAIWISPISAMPVLMREHVNALPLRKLSFSMTSMFSTSPSFTILDIASVITHLKILDPWVLSTGTVEIEALTQLTHLSLRLDFDLSHPENLQKILYHCTSLEVLILHSPKSQNNVNAWLKVHDICDIRTIWTTGSSWWDWFPQNSNHRNIWDCGEDVVAWRRREKGMCQDIQCIKY